MKYLFSIVVSLISILTLSQNSNHFDRTNNDTLPDRFKIEISTLRNHIYDGIPSYSKVGKYEKVAFKFADYAAHSISYDLSNGKVYNNWEELEDYLNQILDKIIPLELKNDTFIRAYIYQDGRFNARMTPSGHIFINIGLISELNNESKIAAVLAHELAHYYKRHSLKHFIKSEFGDFDNIGIRQNKVRWANNSFSKSQELEADSLAMLWMMNSGYNLTSIQKVFKIIETFEQKKLNKSHDLWEIKNIPHATSIERLNAFSKFYKKNKAHNGKFFLISQKRFNRFRKESKIESLKCLINDQKYTACLEKAFKFHLFEPDNPKYIYYIMESIRKKASRVYLFRTNTTWQENFISSNYYDTLHINNIRRKRKITRGLFDKMDLRLLSIPQEEAKHIKASFYWTQEPKYKTYNEAFEFYNALGKVLKCKECALSYALSENDSLKRKDYLNEYLEYDTIQHRNFANNFLNGKISNNNSSKKLLIVSDIFSYIKYRNEKVPINESFEKTSLMMNSIIDSLKNHFPERNILYSGEIKRFNVSDYIALNNLKILTSYRILDPNFLYLFKKYNVNEIEFINCEFYESQSLNNSLEQYQTITNTSYMELFQRTKTTRAFYTKLRSVKLINNEKLEYIIYDDNDPKIKFKNPGYSKIISTLKKIIKRKDIDNY